nr:MAG TPA: hypothetical protein [Caudoviricetes sp.]
MADRAFRATRLKTSHQPTVQQNKPIRDVFADIHVHHCRLAGTITDIDKQQNNPPRRLHTHHSVVASAGRRFARPRIPNLLLSIKNAGTPVLADPFKSA